MKVAKSLGAGSSGNTTMTVAIDGQNIGTQVIPGINSNSVNAHYIKAGEGTLDQLWTGDKSESVTVKLTGIFR